MPKFCSISPKKIGQSNWSKSSDYDAVFTALGENNFLSFVTKQY